jgi:hypothetical protein
LQRYNEGGGSGGTSRSSFGGGFGGGGDDVLVRRIIFAVPSSVEMGGTTGASPALPSPLNRQTLECGGMSTSMSLPSVCTAVESSRLVALKAPGFNP